jgi:hypothetical protein
MTIQNPEQTTSWATSKAMKELNDWAEKLYSHNDFKKVLGAITLCSKPFKPVSLPDPKKKEEKKAKEVE